MTTGAAPAPYIPQGALARPACARTVTGPIGARAPRSPPRPANTLAEGAAAKAFGEPAVAQDVRGAEARPRLPSMIRVAPKARP